MSLTKKFECKHATVMPTFDYEASKGLSSHEVRQRWPRFWGECPDCHQQLILYASREHYYSGDW